METLASYFEIVVRDTKARLSGPTEEPFELNEKAKHNFHMWHIALKKLDLFVTKFSFSDGAEEIDYFKYKKPYVIGKLIYQKQVYHIENNIPYGSAKARKKFFNAELDKITYEFEKNAEFLAYMRSRSMLMDHIYFVREMVDMKLADERFMIGINPLTSTSFDILAGKMQANELLQKYLTECIKRIDTDDESNTSALLKTYKWTESKASLIEFIYALHSTKAIDDGKADIKDIARYCEKLFNVELGDIYRTYIELKMRKTGRTKFIDTMRDGLLKRMDEL